MEKQLKIFLSYCHKTDYDLAKEIKECLEEYWLEVFLAHKSLTPGVEFDEELIENISNCDIFIPILTGTFRDSPFTDQEIGIAVAKDKKIISLMSGDINSPHGFIKDKQAIKLDLSKEEISFGIKKICISICSMLPKEFKSSLFNSWKESSHPSQTKRLVKSLRLINKLSRVEIEDLLKKVFNNQNIGTSLQAREYLKFLIKTDSIKINPKLIEDIEKFLNRKKYDDYLKKEDMKDISKKWQSHRLKLQDTEDSNLRVGIKRDERIYSVRKDRKRFFFPDEWIKFKKSFETEPQKRSFDILINTGASISECRHIKKQDIDFERGTLTIKVAKIKAKKGEGFPDTRTFKLSSQFLEKMRKYTKDLKDDEYIYVLTDSALNIAMNKLLERVGIKDYKMFSVHNIRKTHSIWLKSLGIDSAIILKRMNMSLAAFSNLHKKSEKFSSEEKQKIKEILGDLEV